MSVSDLYDTRRKRAPYPMFCAVIVLAGFYAYNASLEQCSDSKHAVAWFAALILAMAGEGISARLRGGNEYVVLGWIVGTLFITAPIIASLTLFGASEAGCFS